MSFVQWATGTDAAHMSHVPWWAKVAGFFLFAAWFVITWAGSKGRRRR